MDRGQTRSPFVTSGLRIGTPAVTTRGFKETEIKQLSKWIVRVLNDPSNGSVIDSVKKEVLEMCAKFPVYA